MLSSNYGFLPLQQRWHWWWCWCLVSRKLSSIERRRRHERMPINGCLCATKKMLMWYALAERTTSDRRMAIDKTQCCSWSLFTLICIYNWNCLASPSSHSLAFSRSLFVLLPFCFFIVMSPFGSVRFDTCRTHIQLVLLIRLFICLSYLVFVPGCNKDEPERRIRAKTLHKNELLTKVYWIP